jgi:hypothetical protein
MEKAVVASRSSPLASSNAFGNRSQPATDVCRKKIGSALICE